MNFNPEKQNKLEKLKVSSFETRMGSTYKYLPDGRTVRFKKAENKEYEPQDVIVFVPDWKTLSEKAMPESLVVLGNSEHSYEQILLRYCNEMKIFVVDENLNKIKSNKEAYLAKQVFVVLTKDSDTVPDFVIPVSVVPKENYQPYDTRKYLDSNGESKRDQHIGNKITKINY